MLDPQMLDVIKFYAELIASVISLGVTLLGLYLRMYLRESLHAHTDTIKAIVESNYVRRDLYEETIRGLRAQIEGQS